MVLTYDSLMKSSNIAGMFPCLGNNQAVFPVALKDMFHQEEYPGMKLCYRTLLGTLVWGGPLAVASVTDDVAQSQSWLELW